MIHLQYLVRDVRDDRYLVLIVGDLSVKVPGDMRLQYEFVESNGIYRMDDGLHGPWKLMDTHPVPSWELFDFIDLRPRS